jgi:asparagine synthase (glutamine-hydrolysing)
MCGIYGMVARRGVPLHRPAAADAMANALRHRGPDGHGRRAWDDAVVGVTRLRVVDLDPRADQPFTDPSGMVTVACNGEIYNAPVLRRRYADFPYRSASDVEAILPLVLDRGQDGLADLDGMFALAVLDRRAGRLVLARDRAGEKPLFMTTVGGECWFASEIGALLETGAVARALDLGALRAFLRHGYIRGPRTPFAAIRQVPAGTFVSVDDRGPAVRRYWDPDGPARASGAGLPTLLREAVARQVRADVPVGVFTSGGLDSSLLAALAAEAIGAGRVRTFAVGFPDRSYDERRYADRLARALGTTHASVVVEDDQVGEALDTLAATGEPVGDPAAVPTLVLARAAKTAVTVVLSGEGGDELFGGYPTYVGHRLAPYWAMMPAPLRAGARRAIQVLPTSGRRVPLTLLLRRFVAAADLPWPERHAAWFADGLPPDALGAVAWTDDPPRPPPHADAVAGAMRLDYEGPLRERLLVKVDRATMRASLEARAPFLDPAVTRAARAAGGTHVRGLGTKRLLREVARPILPRFILRREKRGLSVPLHRWLRGPLAGATDRLATDGRLAAAGLVDPRQVAFLVAALRAGRAEHVRALWTLLVARHWLSYWNLEIET